MTEFRATSGNHTRVGVLFGGRSSECEVSFATGRYVLNLIDTRRFRATPLYMDPQGRIWKIPPKLVIMNCTADVNVALEKLGERIPYEELSSHVDVIFNALLGKYGEDGAVQGLLGLLKIPFTGSGILPSAVAMNKRATKELLRAAGYKVAKDVMIGEKVWNSPGAKTSIFALVSKELSLPVVVKPVAEGSSVGVGVARDEKSFYQAVEEALRWDSEIVVEEFVRGREFMCIVYGLEKSIAMQPSEVEFQGDIFTYEAKYMPGRALYHTPIRAPLEKREEIQRISESLSKLFGLKGYGRVDGFLTEAGDVIVSEVHTGTIMVPSSYVFQQASLQSDPKAQTQQAALKTKGGSSFNPRTFITQILDYASETVERTVS